VITSRLLLVGPFEGARRGGDTPGGGFRTRETGSSELVLVSQRFLAFATIWALGSTLPGASPRANEPVLVELFTSEGCSSCPPADRVLARLLSAPPAGVELIALGEHVDYWDSLGWKDRYSSPDFTQRQEAYARRLGLSGPYTPQLVVDGRIELVGSDEGAARRAISTAARNGGGFATARVVREDASHLYLDVSAEWAGSGAADVLVAFVEGHARSDVSRGENAGRTLDHVAVALSLAPVGHGTGSFQGSVRVPRPGTTGADRLVVFAQEPNGGPIRAAGTVELR